MSRNSPEMSRLGGQRTGQIGGGHGGGTALKGCPPSTMSRLSRSECPAECPGTLNEGPKSQRELMPVTAEIVDMFRDLVGCEPADATIKAAMQGKGGFWVEERCPDGVVRTFGSKA